MNSHNSPSSVVKLKCFRLPLELFVVNCDGGRFHTCWPTALKLLRRTFLIIFPVMLQIALLRCYMQGRKGCSTSL